MKSSRFATYDLQYHIVWGHKDEDASLGSTAIATLEELFDEIADDKGLEILEKDVKPEYVHLIVSSPPRHSPRLVANWLRGVSSTKYNREYIDSDSEDKIKWSNEYLLGTERAVPTEVIDEYIEGLL